MVATRRELLAGSAALAGTLATPALAQQSPQINWRIASSFPKNLDTIFNAMTLVSERLAELTEDRFKLQVFAAGELVGGLQVLDAVSNGTVEGGHTAGFYYIGKNPALMFDTGVPFGMTPRQHSAWLHGGGGRQLIDEVYDPFNVVAIPAGNTGAQMAGWYRKEIKTPDDLKGLKMRVAGFSGRVMAKLGVIPQQIAAGDIYPALERGTIDAVEFVGPYDDEKLGFYKVASYYYATGVMEPGASISLIVNKDAWQKLPKPYQAALVAACRSAEVETQAAYDAKNAVAIRSLLSKGVQLSHFPLDVVKALRTATNEALEEEAAKSPQFKKIYENWRPFRDQQHTWFSVCDAATERFMYAR